MDRLIRKMFQFYLSSIKRENLTKNIMLITKFQFYLSSIKSTTSPFHTGPFLRFQFYLSSIKRDFFHLLPRSFI